MTSLHAEPLTTCDVIILPVTSLAHCVNARLLQLSRHVERSASHVAATSGFPGHTQWTLDAHSLRPPGTQRQSDIQVRQVSAVADETARRAASRPTCCKQRWMLRGEIKKIGQAGLNQRSESFAWKCVGKIRGKITQFITISAVEAL